jgi:predicted RecA/RadA family phage recombinase
MNLVPDHYSLGFADDYILSGIGDKVDLLYPFSGTLPTSTYPCIVGSLDPFPNSLLICETRLSSGRYVYIGCEDPVAIKNVQNTNTLPITPIGYFKYAPADATQITAGDFCIHTTQWATTISGATAEVGLLQFLTTSNSATGGRRFGSYFKTICGPMWVPDVTPTRVFLNNAQITQTSTSVQVMTFDNTYGKTDIEVRLTNTESTETTRTISVDQSKSTTTAQTLGWSVGGSLSATASATVGGNFGPVSAEASLSVTAEVHSESSGSNSVEEALSDTRSNSYSETTSEVNEVEADTIVSPKCSMVVARTAITTTRPYQSCFKLSSGGNEECVGITIVEKRLGGFVINSYTCAA